MTACNLSNKKCVPCEGGVPKLTPEQVQLFLKEMTGWQTNAEHTEIKKTFEFKNYYHSIAFVNAIAWFTHQENHHPDLEVSYNRVVVRYSTHAISGLSENDFICAAKVETLVG